MVIPLIRQDVENMERSRSQNQVQAQVQVPSQSQIPIQSQVQGQTTLPSKIVPVIYETPDGNIINLGNYAATDVLFYVSEGDVIRDTDTDIKGNMYRQLKNMIPSAYRNVPFNYYIFNLSNNLMYASTSENQYKYNTKNLYKRIGYIRITPIYKPFTTHEREFVVPIDQSINLITPNPEITYY